MNVERGQFDVLSSRKYLKRRAGRQTNSFWGKKKFHFDPDELNDGNGKMFMLDEPNFSTLTQTLSFEENSAKE